MTANKSSNVARWWKPVPETDLTLFKASFSTFVYDRHTHDEYAIGVIESGAQRFFHKGSSHTVTPMSVVTVNPDEVHDGEALGDEYSYRMMYVGESYLRSLFGDDYDAKGFLGFKSPQVEVPEIGISLSRAMRLMDGPEASRDVDMDSLFAPILFDLFSRFATPRPLTPSVDSLRDVNLRAVNRAVEYIQSNCTDIPSLESIASEVGLSKFHFLRMFKKQTGFTPHAYGLRYRVRLARQALERGASPLEAALQAGFADQSHLTRRFKAMYGVTPGAFVRSF